MSSDQGALPYVAPSPPPVGPTLVSIAVTPASPTLAVAATLQFVATGTYSDASVADVTSSSTWGSATPAKATISAGGLATGVAAGTSVISATIGAVSGNTTLTIASTSGGGEPGPTPVPPIPPSSPPAPPSNGLIATYSSPTTPASAPFAVDVTGYIRLGSITGLAGEAEMGAVGSGNTVLDDVDGTVGYLSDGIVGLKQWSFDELRCPPGNQRLWTGYVADRRYFRGTTEPSGTDSSLITGVERKIDVSLLDTNSFLSFRVFAPTADDPTSDFVRPAETDLERVQALLTTVDFISTTLFDIGFIPTTGGVAMDANDYTGMRPIDVLNDCAQASGRNFWVLYWEPLNEYVLWYDVWTTDGSATRTYDSTLRLTNVLSEVDDIVTFVIEPNAVAVLDPSRVISAIRGTGTGVTGYETNPATANTFAWRDGSPLNPNVKTQPVMDALLLRYLNENATEDERISLTVRVPASQVTSIHEGMRIPLHATHLPAVQDDFTWCRILQRTIRQDVQTDQFYWLDLELSPPPVTQTVVIGIYLSNSGFALTPNWPTGWAVIDTSFAPASGGGHPLYITTARGPANATSARVCASVPCGGGDLGNSFCLMVFEVTGTTGIGPVQSQVDPGGTFTWPNVVMPAAGLLLAPMMRWASSTPRNDPATNWENTKRFRGTSATSYAIPSGTPLTFTTQTGLLFQFGGDHSTVYFVSRANPANYMIGFIQSYNSSTGALDIEPYRTFGSGTHTDWDIYIGFNSFNDLGDRDYVNCEDRTVSVAGTYGGSEAAAGNCIVVVVPFNGPDAALGKAGVSGLYQGGTSNVTVSIS